MADGRIDVEVGINTGGIDKDAKAVGGKLQKLAKDVTKNVGEITKSFSSIGLAAGAVTGAAALVAKGIKETTEAYRVQAAAETQLAAAAKNNPYLNEASVDALKAYASGLQSISTVGDEQLLPLMANLAATGRTQQQIQEITSAAVDLAASGTMDLNSAVSALNATYNGMAGSLGKQNGAIKNLTEEQLKNGEAVKIVAEQYKGMAKQVAETTGSAQQLANTWGDFKEYVGGGLEAVFTPIRRGIEETIGSVNTLIDSLQKADKIKKLTEKRKYGDGTDDDLLQIYELEKQKLDAIKQKLDKNQRLLDVKSQIFELERERMNFARKDEEGKRIDYKIKMLRKEATAIDRLWELETSSPALDRELLQKQYDAQKKVIDAMQEEVDAINAKIKAQADALAAEAEAAKIADENKAKADAALAAYRKTIADKERELKIRRELGEAITEEQKNEEMLQTRIGAYIKLIQDAQGAITGELEREQIERKKILDLVEKTAKAEDELKAETAKKELIQKLNAALGEEKLRQSEIMARQIHELEVEYEKLTAEKKTEIHEEYIQKLAELYERQRQMKAEESAADEAALYSSLSKKLDIVTSFASQYTGIMSTVSALVIQQAKDEATVKQAELEKQYSEGIISEEEYANRKIEIEKEAAETSYRIRMWQWAGSIAEATANTALAMVNTLAQTPGPAVIKLAMAALVAAAGGAQLASIIANKPIPPSNFATGGIVGGTSYTGDKVTAHVNSGEMILNRAQQRNLFDSINSNQLGSSRPQMNVRIFNSASNEVSATPELTEDGMKIMIRKTVNDDIGKGHMNKSLVAAQSSFSGTRYTS